MPNTKIPAQIDAKLVILILCGVIGALLASFLMMGCVVEYNETSKMKACVAKNGNWVNSPGGPECRMKLDTQPTPSYSSGTETNKPR